MMIMATMATMATDDDGNDGKSDEGGRERERGREGGSYQGSAELPGTEGSAELPGAEERERESGEIRVDLGLKWNGWMDLSRTKWTNAQECVMKCDMLNGGAHCQRLWRVNKGREGREVKTLFPLKTLFLEGRAVRKPTAPKIVPSTTHDTPTGKSPRFSTLVTHNHTPISPIYVNPKPKSPRAVGGCASISGLFRDQSPQPLHVSTRWDPCSQL